MEKDNNINDIPTYGKISALFVRLIGYINLILQFESYEDGFDDYNMILDFIYKSAVTYEKERNLSFINNSELVEIYELSDRLQTKFICNDNLGSESEFLKVIHGNILQQSKTI